MKKISLRMVPGVVIGELVSMAIFFAYWIPRYNRAGGGG
jgi:hypothetical protein